MVKLTRRERRTQKRPILPIKESSENDGEAIDIGPHREYKSRFSRLVDRHLHKTRYIALIIFIFCIGVIIYEQTTTGSFIQRDISLTGGQTITITEKGLDSLAIQADLRSKLPDADISVRSLSEFGDSTGIIVEANTDTPLRTILDDLKGRVPDIETKYSVETTGPSLSKNFFSQLMIAIGIAFVFMSIVIFLLFKTFAPSMAVISCAFADIVFAVAMTNLFNIKLSTAGIVAFLMLVGYSVDTDILLTTRLLKGGKGDYLERTISSMKTGLTMTFTILATVLVGLIFGQSDVFRQIFSILLFGLIADIIFTYLWNGPLLWSYMERSGLKPK